MQARWDIFCRVIDNYGDIGVCWRLARQLAAEYGLAVRLWVDDPASLKLLAPDLTVDREKQHISGVEVCRWPADFPETAAADVVVEAFACDLPANYLQAMAARPQAPAWFNLEYLSAEDWVEGCHGLASPHTILPLSKIFFFPGLTARTGGLPRERDLLARRDAAPAPAEDAFTISLFCYDDAAAGELIAALAATPGPVRLLVPPGKPWQAVRRHLDGDGPWQIGHVSVEPIPFCPQADYDALLWSCDLNFVRGEDSFVRGQWAGRPFVWQIYRQNDGAHRVKLDAFLDRYTAGMAPELGETVRTFFTAWNEGHGVAAAWPAFFAAREALTVANRAWTDGLAQQPDLAANLVNAAKKRV